MGRKLNGLALDRPLLAPSDCLRFGASPVRIEDGALVVKCARSPSRAERAALLAAASEPCSQVRVQLVDKPTLKRLPDAQMAHDSFEKLIARMRDGEPDPTRLRAALLALLHEAIDRRCSDIHLDNKPDPRAWVSLRIDSRLRPSYLLPEHLMAAVFARLKTVSDGQRGGTRAYSCRRFPAGVWSATGDTPHVISRGVAAIRVQPETSERANDTY